MLKHDYIISLMTLEKKLRILISNQANKSGTCEGFKLPKFNFIKDMNQLELEHDASLTAFPTERMLFQSFDLELIKDVIQLQADELFMLDPLSILCASSSMNDVQNLTENDYYLTKLIEAKSSSLAQAHDNACFDSKIDDKTDMIQDQSLYLPKAYMESVENIKFVIVHHFSDFLEYQKTRQNCYYIACTDVKEEVIQYLQKGVLFICYTGSDYDAAIQYVLSAVNEYDDKYAQYQNDLISAVYLGLQIEKGYILDKAIVDQRLDDFLEVINEIKKEHKHIQNDQDLDESLEQQRKAKLDKKAYQAALQSIVMLKNDGDTLPLRSEKKVAIIGDWFENDEYIKSRYTNAPKKMDKPFEHLNICTEINAVGYAHGYLKGNEDVSLIPLAVDLCRQAEIAVLYLWKNDEEEHLSNVQLQLIQAIYETGCKIVAIINSSNYFDLSFADQCSAILLVTDGGQNARNATLDILNGDEAPAGFLAAPWYLNESHAIRYPFGYGLSYGTVQYHHLKVTETGATIQVTNISAKPCYALCLLYVKSNDPDDSFFQKQLRGFKKVFLQPSESKLIEMNFDSFTFRQFISPKKGYGNRKGEYIISIFENESKEVQYTTISLAETTISYYETFNQLNLAGPESDIDEFMASYEQESPMPHKKKIAIWLALYLYFNIVLIVAFVSIFLFMRSKYQQSYLWAWIITLATIVIFNVVMFGILIHFKMVKKRLLEESTTLPNVFASLNVFGETNVIIKPQPVEPKPVGPIDEVVEVEENQETPILEEVGDIEQNNLDELVEQSTVSEEDLAEYEAQMKAIEELNMASLFNNDSIEETIVYDKESNLSQLIDRFIQFAKGKGLIIEPSCVRSIFGHLCSSKLIIFSSKSLELMPLFLEVLTTFLGNTPHILHASDSWISTFDISWYKDTNGNYVKTEFINDVYKANKQKESINLAIIDQVNMTNVMYYSQELIDFAATPKTHHSIKINQKISVPIAENTIFILIPKDNFYLQNIPDSLAKNASCIELLMYAGQAAETQEKQINCLSYPYFEELILDSKKDNYLSEEAWKKIDAFYQELNKLFPIQMESKFATMVERYAALLLDCKEFEQDVVDAVVAEKIIPIVACSEFVKDEKNHKTIIDIIEKIFGQGNANKTIRAFHNLMVSE